MKFIVKENDEEYEFLLGEGVYVVGRHPTCDLVLRSEKISRRHMSCSVGTSEIKVQDLGSRNGIYLDGSRVKSALVRPGQCLRVGDVELILKGRGGTGAPAAAPPREEGTDHYEAPEGPVSVEDQEQTPVDESALPARTDGPQAQVVKRDGRWFAVDSAIGRQVEIVPAERQRSLLERLLPTRKIRIGAIVGAIFVLLLFAAALYKGIRPDRSSPMPGERYSRLMDGAIRALDQGERSRSLELARMAARGRPERAAPQILIELAGLWEPWHDSFMEHWSPVNRLLEELRDYYNSQECKEFVRKYTDWIDRQLTYFAAYNEARAALEAGRYEEAFKALDSAEIPDDAVVRTEKSAFLQGVRNQFRQHIDRQIEDATSRRDWTMAEQWAEKLRTYFPEQSEAAEQQLERFRGYARDKRCLEQARQRIQEGRFGEAADILGRVPDSSPHHEEAARLMARTDAGGMCARALSLYHKGKIDEALDMLREKDDPGCTSLRDHLEAVRETYRAAVKAEANQKLLDAGELWRGLKAAQESFFRKEHPELASDTLVNGQDLPENHYYSEATSSLRTMTERRTQLALTLVEQGKTLVEQENYQEAKKLYERARTLDPEGQAGTKALEQLRSQGHKDYWSALVEMDKDPQKALELLERASVLLPADDEYYPRVLKKKKEARQKLSEGNDDQEES